MRRRLAALAVPVLLVLAGCTATTGPQDAAAGPERGRPTRPSPFADCATLTAPPATPVASGSAGAGDGGGTPGSPAPADDGSRLPELVLSCFTGGSPVALRDIRGPAVINVWASWCPPCRKELPAFQRLSVRAAGQLQVIGVNSRDSRDGAQAIGEDFGIRFPVLFDQGEALQRELRRSAVPLTLLVDAQGRVRHTDTSGALDDARLADLVRRHLGLAVPA
ncbi:TlpA family protein disulfide reductase [Micromonospora rifamycinica]|uniref:Thiol-disulfide isomerase or thioredoxin n=1 Tax=Micromonospora rifamycinica TaxID=291594 RepID=A0A109ILB2_9ACTN|nr:TlpA disulfide reductase family protein [Micromonospora rifamycinica]KWV32664.1 alkyl hydroperoxide reductase [Micromonospora rifamycinica]SCG76473.1 Thiol-disulfide isomerase or thioredoxin [Micromonospora rifamycinica]